MYTTSTTTCQYSNAVDNTGAPASADPLGTAFAFQSFQCSTQTATATPQQNYISGFTWGEVMIVFFLSLIVLVQVIRLIYDFSVGQKFRNTHDY